MLPRLVLGAGAGSVPELASRYLEEYVSKIRLAVENLDGGAIWHRSDEGSNAIGNLILHLCGNLSLWVRAELGGRPFVRDRAAEFAARGGLEADELLGKLDEVVGDCQRVVTELDQAKLAERHTVQGYEVDGLGALFHAVEHMSYHTGQIVLLAKQRLAERGEGLDFYPHLSAGEEE